MIWRDFFPSLLSFIAAGIYLNQLLGKYSLLSKSAIFVSKNSQIW